MVTYNTVFTFLFLTQISVKLTWFWGRW